MPDDKSKVGEPDRSKVAANQNYKVSQLAQKHGLTQQQARDLIARVGNERDRLERAAKVQRTHVPFKARPAGRTKESPGSTPGL